MRRLQPLGGKSALAVREFRKSARSRLLRLYGKSGQAAKNQLLIAAAMIGTEPANVSWQLPTIEHEDIHESHYYLSDQHQR